MFCKYCGEQIKESALFCQYCGQSLKKKQTTDNTCCEFTEVLDEQPNELHPYIVKSSVNNPVNIEMSDNEEIFVRVLDKAIADYDSGNYIEALEVFYSLLDDEIALYYIGHAYENGNSLVKDIAKAIEYYTKSAELGDADAQFRLGLITEDSEDSYFWLRLVADREKHAVAQHFVGLCFEIGDGVDENPNLAFSYFSKSAQNNDLDSMFKIGYYYEHGLGGQSENESEAYKWYMKAAEGGDEKAQYCIGLCYQYSKLGIVEDFSTAMEWYNKSAEQGHVASQNLIGYYLGEGIGLDKDEIEAYKWFCKAYENGSAIAAANIGEWHEFGKGGVAQDYAKAIEWYKEAVKMGYSNDEILEKLKEAE